MLILPGPLQGKYIAFFFKNKQIYFLKIPELLVPHKLTSMGRTLLNPFRVCRHMDEPPDTDHTSSHVSKHKT